MNILLSNDDGYYAKGIEMLFDALSQFANVTMVAPENNCSGASSSLTLKNPLRIRKFKDEGYYINGTPSDCVFMALTRILQDPPDLLVSGINHGANLGDDVLYSGTVGAALGGRFLNIPCLAISITSLKPNHLETAVRVSSELIKNNIEYLASNPVLNINIPDVSYTELKGFKVTRLGRRAMPESNSQNQDAYGDDIHWVGPPPPPKDLDEGTDFHAIHNKIVSITPLISDLTNYEQLKSIEEWSELISQ
ncbi:MAG: 5'/3'-nucleotidase SurE [Gammaproteobacteria bacterium]|nr:5'/3'-nucleotidase SurE [Gammaproteobacteria bacterium]MBT6073869.1 5'/3'-nucleotidase SurE [Gammaproteobacteria bacterium]MBT7753386.1 5'/3'-nucleotidase SurE [Gammaproteobacteria bacterium]MDG2434985.1 5'/3'-nucleotidase SurE [Gammaproteobacteria bacterium]